MNILTRLMLTTVVFVAAAACQPVMPETSVETVHSEDGPQRITVTYSNDGINVDPSQVSAGASTLVLQNDGEIVLGGPFGRFHDGKAVEDFIASSRIPGGFAALSMLDLIGGVPLDPGATQELLVSLSPGNYLFIANGTDGGLLTGTMEVNGSDVDGGEIPPGDVPVTIVDFAYELPATISAGQNVWQIHNEGSQMHEMFVVPIEPGTSLETATEIIRSIGSPFALLDGSSPVDVAFLYGPISPGVEAKIPLALDEGTYAIGPLLPDMATVEGDGQPTLLLDRGMVSIVTVE